MKIICIGEVLIDFTPYQEEGTYIRNFGGAPANVAIIAAKLGQNVQFIGKIGNDQFGKYLVKELQKAQVDTGHIIVTDKACTTLAFVHLSGSGERSFDFVRKPGADMLLSEEDIPDDFCASKDIVHFGSAQLMTLKGRKAIFKAIDIAHARGAIVSFDPNYRAPQWSSERKAKKWILEYIYNSDIIKISEEEGIWLTGHKELRKMLHNLDQDDKKLIVVTYGAKGAYYKGPGFFNYVPGYPAQAVDTTGAGDAFWGTFLSVIAKCMKDPPRWVEESVRRAVKLGNVAGALCVENKGAIIPEHSLTKLREQEKRGIIKKM